MKDFYYILGVDANCSSIEIKEAYRKLSKKFHPDLNQNDKYFENRFRETHEAYIILNDPAQRAIYDRNLKRFKSPLSSAGASSSAHYTPKPPPGAYAQARPAASYKINPRKSIDVLFTVILIAVTLMFGNYVYNALNAPVKSKPYIPPAVTTATVTAAAPLKHHHHRHNLINKTVTESGKVSSATAVMKPAIEAVKVVAPPAMPANIPLVVKAVPPAPVKDYLYRSAVHANLTGIVNMRESAQFGAEVLKEIPGNSEVEVLEKGNTYYKVRFDGVDGFVPKWAVIVK